MSAITISRQMNNRGDELGLHVAQQLGWRCIGRDLINQAALAAGAPQVALVEIDELGFFGLRPSAKEWRAYQSQVERIIRELADEGNVIIMGRGGQIVLRDRPDVLHVRVVASFETRVKWLQQEKNMSEESAQACLARSDKARTRYVRRSYHVDVNDPVLYHLVINTGLLGLPQAANLIEQTFRQAYDSI
jgi:cytidylate kinase